jgi:mannosyltransferase OCH1-like enzyme
MPEPLHRYGQTWEAHHPRWDVRLWTDAEADELMPAEAMARARNDAERANLLRYELLRRFGGVYVDTDFECRRPLDPLLAGIDAFAASESPGRAACGILGATPGHPAFEAVARLSRETVGLGAHNADGTGPYLLTVVLADHPEVTIFGPELFYPYLWHEPERQHAEFPDAYAVHHWAGSWRAAWR